MIAVRFTQTTTDMRKSYRVLRKSRKLNRQAANWAMVGYYAPDWVLTAISYGTMIRNLQEMDVLYEAGD